MQLYYLQWTKLLTAQMYYTGTEEVITEWYSVGDPSIMIAVRNRTPLNSCNENNNNNKETNKNKKGSEIPCCFETIFSTKVHRRARKIQLRTLRSFECYSTWLSYILRHDLISNGKRTDLAFHGQPPTELPLHIPQLLANLASYLCAPIFLRFFLWFCIVSSFRVVLCKAKERGLSVLLIICVPSLPFDNLTSRNKLDRKPMKCAQRVEKLD